MHIENSIKNLLKKVLPKDVEIKLEVPPNKKLGDYAFPCYQLAPKLKKPPEEIAKLYAKKLQKIAPKLISKIEANFAYINFFINPTEFAKGVISSVLKQKEKYGSINIGKKKKLLIEHTSINPNAPPHVGRARNALIGDSLARLLRFVNYNVDVHYFVNDVGKQIAMLVYACKNKKQLSFEKMLEYYIGINKNLTPQIEKEIFDLLYKLEQGDKKVKEQFKKIVDICLKGQLKILSELNIRYDHFDYESKYLWARKTKEILKQLEKTNKLTIDSHGRYVLDLRDFNLDMKDPVLVLTRADGTSLYSLRDIAYTIEKLEKAKENIVVLGEDHKLYFQQITSALSLLNYHAPRAVFYSHVLLKTGKMSTREGNLVLLQDFMKQAIEKANQEFKKRGNYSKKAIKTLAYASVKYAILKVSPEKNVIFDWEQALSYEGDAAPYLLYSYARASSIIKKAPKLKAKADFNYLNSEAEKELIKEIYNFPSIVKEAASHLKPSIIANYAYELAKKFNEFYQVCRCIVENKQEMAARLALVEAFRYTIKNTLLLLGIETLERM